MQLGNTNYGNLRQRVQLNGKEVHYDLDDYIFDLYKRIDLKSFAKLADKPTVTAGENILYLDIDIPIEVGCSED